MFLYDASPNGNPRVTPLEPGPIPAAHLVRILVIQLKRLGDLVLTTPVLSALRQAFPDAQIVLAAAGASAGLAPILGVNETLFFGNGAGDWRRLLRGRFDVCLDFTGNDRSMLISALSRAQRRITYSRFSAKPFRRWIYSDFVESDVKNRHTADHHTDLLRPLGLELEQVPGRLHFPESIAARTSEPYAIVHAGSARSEKYWDANRWAQVADWLAREKGLRVFLTGGRGLEEIAHLQKIRAATQTQLTDLSGKLSLVEFAEWIAGATILCSVDSLPIHVADALRTPVVALFGPTDPRHWRPRFSRNEMVRAPQMNAITTDQVTAAVSRILAG